VGVFVAVIWYEKALPAVPLAAAPLVITGGATKLMVALAKLLLYVAVTVAL